MRETRLSGSEGGGDELNRLSLPLSSAHDAVTPVTRILKPTLYIRTPRRPARHPRCGVRV
jgi:hypothetical protein